MGQTEVFTPGFFLNAAATGNVFGFKFDFKIDVSAPVPRTAGALAGFISNPLSVLDQVGFTVSANVSLPFGLGEAQMLGVLSTKEFKIEATLGIPLGKLELASMHFLT